MFDQKMACWIVRDCFKYNFWVPNWRYSRLYIYYKQTSDKHLFRNGVFKGL